MREVILTGIRSNNKITIGNYFGAILPIIKRSNDTSSQYDIHLFIPDLHSITTEINYLDLYNNTINHLKFFVAAGLPLDNPNVHIYRQSFVSAHSELAWILGCFSGFGELSRMTQFKDKSLNNKNLSVGLFNYPVLMVADILLYNTTYISVGEDQVQHLEFTRNLAQKFNSKFGNIFVIPKELKSQNKFFKIDKPLRIKDLYNPDKKMSKSSESDKGVIFLEDDPEISAEKIKKATTDNLSKINYDPELQPGISNLIELLSLLDNVSIQDILKDWKDDSRYSDFKNVVAETYTNFANDFKLKLSQVDENKILKKLESDEVKMNQIANETLLKVQKAVGLRKWPNKAKKYD